MNKKGFTLTELLIVIVLLIVVMGSTILNMQKISEESKIKNLKRIKTQVELATKVYFNNTKVYEQSLLNGTSTEICTRLYVLENKNLIDIDLTDPMTGKRIPGNLCVMSRLNDEGIVEHHFEYIENIINEYENK